MRKAFVKQLCEEARRNPNIWLLCGDLGYSVLEEFSEQFPDRFLNMGVAEQNMIGVAAGLSVSGKMVFTYSIANFSTLRCLEQIRNDICYHKLDVTIVSVGSGMSYGTAGYSHYGIENLSIMRTLPNLTVLSPGDPIEARESVIAAIAHKGPCYLHLGKGGESIINREPINFEIGKAITLLDGEDVVFITTGSILGEVYKAALSLRERGISAGVVSMHTLNPSDNEIIIQSAMRAKEIITVEESVQIGGLGETVAAVLALNQISVKFRMVNIHSPIPNEIGSQTYLREILHLSSNDLINLVLEKS